MAQMDLQVGSAQPTQPLTDDVDLLEVIDFSWKSRWRILIGTLAGASIALAVWTMNQLSNTDTSGTIRSVTFSTTALYRENSLLAFVQSLSSFLKTSEGIQAYFEGLEQATALKSASLVNWRDPADKEALSVQSLQLRDNNVVVSVDENGFGNIENIKILLPLALNHTTYAIKEFYSKAQEENLRDIMGIDSSIADLNYQALVLFEKYSSLGAQMRTTLLTAFTTDSQKKSSPDMLLFLLAPVSNTNPEKKLLIEKYAQLSLRKQILESKHNVLNTTFGITSLEGNPRLDQIIEIGPAISISDTAKRHFLQRPLPLVAIGALVGFLVGVAYSLIHTFWRNNRDRLQAIVHGPR